MVVTETQKFIKKFIKKFDAKTIQSWDGKVSVFMVGPNQVAIATTKSVPDGCEFLVRVKDLKKVLECDIFSVPVMLDSGLIEELSHKRVPVGRFRKLRKEPKIYYPTGIIEIDTALFGGFRGKIVNRIWGPSESGKSFILYMTMITAWEQFRKPSLLIETEFDFDEDRIDVLPGGSAFLDSGALKVFEPGSSGEAYDKAIEEVQTGRYAILGIDSVTASMSEEEMKKSLRKKSKVGSKSLMQSRFLENVLPILYHQSPTALIAVAQSRKNISISGGTFKPTYEPVAGMYSPGGANQAAAAALQFYTQVSLNLSAPKGVKRSDGNIIAHTASGIVDKNKRAPKGRKFEFFIHYFEGIKVIPSLVNEAVAQKVIDTPGGSVLVLPDGSKFKSSKQAVQALQDDPELYRQLYSDVLKEVQNYHALLGQDYRYQSLDDQEL